MQTCKFQANHTKIKEYKLQLLKVSRITSTIKFYTNTPRAHTTYIQKVPASSDACTTIKSTKTPRRRHPGDLQIFHENKHKRYPLLETNM